MNKFLKATTALFLTIQVCFSQTLPQPLQTLKAGWERIYIKDVGSFDLPSTMEVQKGKYKEFVDEIHKIKGFEATQLTAQQKGLNEFGKEGFEKYARVMVETTLGRPNDFEKLNFNISTVTESQIAELNISTKKEIQQNFTEGGLKIIEWYPLKLEKINGMACIHVSYKRQLKDNPLVIVHMYSFQNYDRIHMLTLSYRLSEADYWKADYETILRSFRITNIK